MITENPSHSQNHADIDLSECDSASSSKSSDLSGFKSPKADATTNPVLLALHRAIQKRDGLLFLVNMRRVNDIIRSIKPPASSTQPVRNMSTVRRKLTGYL